MIYSPVREVRAVFPKEVADRHQARLMKRLRGDIKDILCVGRTFYVTVGDPKRRSGPWKVVRHTPTTCRFEPRDYKDPPKTFRRFEWAYAERLLEQDAFYFTNTAEKWKAKNRRQKNG